MGFFSKVGQNVGRFAKAVGNKTARVGREIGRFAYNNRDLIAKTGATFAPVVAGGIAGGIPGAIGAGIVQKEAIKGLGKDIKNRIQGKTKGGDINFEDIKKIAKTAQPHVLKKLDQSRKKMLKNLAQGQSVG